MEIRPRPNRVVREEKDRNGNVIYREFAGGFWWIRKYDRFNRCTRYRDSAGEDYKYDCANEHP